MRWENKRYTPEELRKMQQEAVERVRQMQRRSQEVVHNSPRAPSFFAQNQEQDGHAEHREASAPSVPEKGSKQTALPAAKQRPTDTADTNRRRAFPHFGCAAPRPR